MQCTPSMAELLAVRPGPFSGEAGWTAQPRELDDGAGAVVGRHGIPVAFSSSRRPQQLGHTARHEEQQDMASVDGMWAQSCC